MGAWHSSDKKALQEPEGQPPCKLHIQGECQKGRKALEHQQESEEAGSKAGGYQGN